MTKTLTEQWRDGELPFGIYYFKTQFDNVWFGFPARKNMLRVIDNGLYDDSDKIEVLSEVPSYYKYQRLVSKADESATKCSHLEKQLKIATKALDNCRGFDFVKQALKEIKEVK